MIDFEQKNSVDEQIVRLTKVTQIFSLVRFFFFVCIVIFLVCLISLDQFVLYLVLSLSFIGLFTAFILLTNRIYHKLKIYKNMALIYKKHENRRNLSYQSFTPDGREFINYEDYKELDLDILGPRSLFQYLCAAKTKEGRAKLAKQLTCPEPKDSTFTNCVAAFAKTEQTLKLEASIALLDADAKECEQEELLGVVHKKIVIPWYGILGAILSYIALIVAIIMLNFYHIDLYYVLFFIPLNFIIAKKACSNEVFSFPATKYANLLSAYQRFAMDVLEFKLVDPYFENLQKTIQQEYSALVSFHKMFELLSYRKNILLSILGNGVFFMDYWIAWRFTSFSKRIDSIKECLDSLSEIELLMSLATIGIDQQTYAIPTTSMDFVIEEGYHPLVRGCVPNSIRLSKGIVLTGSNMSGKTTFMRMLGINQILANAGGLVCAKAFSTRPYEVVTSLRANDMLQEGISTFYAEINRMKRIVTMCKEKPTLVLIDEIFKGTNAKDRIYAAKEIIQKLNEFSVLFLITTHDFELCEVESIENYHFDETYVEDKISFDYKLKNGKCQKTNAIYLLKLAGVLE